MTVRSGVTEDEAGARGLRAIRLLLIDDDEDWSGLAVRHFEASGYEVVHAGSLAGARRAFAGQHFDVCLADYQLPDGVGSDFAAEVGRAGLELPCLLVTAHPAHDVEQAALRSGSAEYLPKDLPLEHIERSVRWVLERRRATDALRRKERRYRDLFETSRDAITISSPAGQLLEVNDAALRMFGLSRAEASRLETSSQYVRPEERRTLLAAASNGGVKDFPIELYRSDGTIIECLVSASLTPEGHLLAITRDVSAQNRAQRELRRLVEEHERVSAHLRDFLQNLPGIAWEIRLGAGGQEVVTLGTGLRSDFLGLSREEWVDSTRDWEELMHPDDLPLARNLMDAVFRGETIEPAEMRVRGRDGAYVWTEVRAFAALGDAGTVVAVQGMTLDISKRKAAEQELIQKQELLHRILENLPVAVAMLSHAHRVAWVNAAWERTLGWSGADLTTDDPFARLFESGVGSLGQAQSGPPHWEERETRTKRGHSRHMSWAHLRLPGHSALLIGVDVTEQRELQHRLEQAARMEAIGRLAGGIAHDFNNLLTVVLGCAEVLLASPATASDEALEIRHAAERGAMLTRQLLAFSRRQVLQQRRLDLNAVISGLDRMLARLVGEDILLHTRLSATPLVVRADHGQIEQVITNLVVNARDAMPGGGDVRIESREVEAPRGTELAPGRYAMVSVIDNGPGIETDIVPHIFEPFFSTKGAAGTGLGLATVYGIVKQSDGEIRVSTRPGAGARFDVFLPMILEAAEPTAARFPEQSGAGSGTILIIEDEPAVLGLLRSILLRNGYTVVSAASEAQFSALLQAGLDGVDLLVTDMVLPWERGDQLAARVREARPSLPVLFVSGYSDRGVPGGAQAQRTAFLAKPFSRTGLLAAVRQLLESA